MWLAVDRQRNKVIDIEVTTSREFSAYLPMALRLKKKYKVKILCTDDYGVYKKYSVAKRHVITNSIWLLFYKELLLSLLV